MAHEFEEFHQELDRSPATCSPRIGPSNGRCSPDAGWVGLEVPDEFGGAGATFAEVAVICEEMGRAASANSYLGSAVLAVGTLKALQPGDTRDALLSDVASGAVRVAVALGSYGFVPDADGADRLLVVTTDPRERRCRRCRSPGRHAATGGRRNTPAGHGVRRRCRGRGGAAIRRRPRRSGLSSARQSRGRDRVRQPRASEAMLSATVCYAKVRQAVRQADRLLPGGQARVRRHAGGIAVSRQLVDAAVEAVAEDRHRRRRGGRMAKSYTCGAAVDVAGKAMQLHGGIGYTWESGIHVYLKRAALNRSLFGSPAAHRRRLAKRYLSNQGVSTMGVPVYKRILDLFEAEGVNTLFGIPDPNFVHMFAEADARGWSVVAPHHELSAGFMAEAVSRMTGGPGLCIGTLGPGMANMAGAIMCAKVENSPVIFLGGQRARITERRVRRGRIQFVRQEGTFRPIGQVQRIDRVRRPNRRDRPRSDPAGDVRHPRPVLHRVPVARHPRGARRCRPVAAEPVPAGEPGCRCTRGGRGRRG